MLTWWNEGKARVNNTLDKKHELNPPFTSGVCCIYEEKVKEYVWIYIPLHRKKTFSSSRTNIIPETLWCFFFTSIIFYFNYFFIFDVYACVYVSLHLHQTVTTCTDTHKHTHTISQRLSLTLCLIRWNLTQNDVTVSSLCIEICY